MAELGYFEDLEPDELISQRKEARRRLTNLHNKFMPAALDLAVDIEELREANDTVKAVTKDLATIDRLLLLHWSPEQRGKEVDAVGLYREKSQEVEHRFRRACRIRGITEGVHPLPNPPQPVATPTSRVKLPKLAPPSFDGQLLSWQAFADQFEATIHNNASLSSVEKLAYLRNCLSGTAAKAIAGLPLSDASYAIAWAELKQQFGRIDVLVQAHLQGLQSLPRHTDSTSIEKMRDFFASLSIHIRSLQSLNVDVDGMKLLLSPMILAALPPEWAARFRIQRGIATMASVTEVWDFLRQEIESREEMLCLRQMSEKLPKLSLSAVEEKVKPTKTKLSAEALTTEVQPQPPSRQTKKTQRNSRFPCVFCGQEGHWSTSCPKHATAKDWREILQAQGRCFVCLRPDHFVANCDRPNQFCRRCGQRHHVSLCGTSTSVSQIAAIQEPLVSHVATSVVLCTATIWVSGQKGRIQARCLLDDGSQSSFILTSLAHRVGAKKLETTSVRIRSFGNPQGTWSTKPVFQLYLQGREGGPVIGVSALGEEKVCGTLPTVSDPAILQLLRQQGLPLADPPVPGGQEKPVELLLGSDVYWQIVTGKMHPLDGSIGLIETHFGWMINGSVPSASTSCLSVHVGHVSVEDQLRDFWKLDHEGLFPAAPCEDSVFKDFCRSATREKDGRYVVRLPFNEKAVSLVSNWSEAFRRLRGQVLRLKDNPKIRTRYAAAMEMYFDLDHAEVVPDRNKANFPLYYIPHHAVIREDRVTTKVRVVFDASSHGKNQLALNDCLHTGPSFLPDCAALLIRWRSYLVPVVADIVKAFLQVRLATEDRDAVRFLWVDPSVWERPFSEESLLEALKVCRMKVVIFGANSSPFLLCATIRHHAASYKRQFPEASKMLSENIYMDDLLAGGHSLEQAKQHYTDMKNILMAACMPLSKWATSSHQLHELWKDLGEDVASQETVLTPDSNTKVLGFHWHCLKDHLYFGRNLAPGETYTKRTLLQTAARLFDPLGLIGPFTMRAKIMMQELWLLAKSWDDPLEEPLLTGWKNWLADLPNASQVAVPRCLFAGSSALTASWSLHMFCDASEQAYGAAVYCRIEDPAAGVFCRLVASKNRVAPLKKITLPRLELMGALLGARLVNYVSQALDLPSPSTQTVCWTDSQICYYWIQGDPRRWKTFVANRIQEIRDLTSGSQWRHVPGADNSADMVTRGTALQTLISCSLWWEGPQWLLNPEAVWPQEVSQRMLSTGEEAGQTIVSAAVAVGPSPIDISRFSNFGRLLRVTAWVRRVIYRERRLKPNLEIKEIMEAREYWVRQVQAEAFGEEIGCLRLNKALPSKSALRQLSLFLDNGLLRLRSRLQQSNLPYPVRYPLLLPPGGPFVTLLLLDTHTRLLHAGPQETLVDIREEFWVLRGRKAAERAIRRCMCCRRYKAQPGTVPTAPLPLDRLRTEAPFSVTGIDFAGPIFIREKDGSSSKGYIALFSCASTRAVHAELVSSMTVESFILALRRFFSRYGISHTIWSDNGRTFLRARKELRPLWDLLTAQETTNFLLARRVVWRTIIERAPWWGGFWERMVRSVKERLRKLLGQRSLDFETIATLLLEVSAAINSRPLLQVSENAQDPEVLTPGHFLLCRRPASLPSPRCLPPGESSAKRIAENWRERMRLMEQFWRIWRRDYLLLLRGLHQVQPKDGSRPFKVGEVVLLQQDNIPRHCWPLARVTSVMPGRDGHIRGCEVRTATGSVFRRPIQHLFRLEV